MSVDRARRVFEIESKAIADLIDRVGDEFLQAVEIILACQGKTIVIGIGKSGLVGRKIAATLAGTGTPAFFVHPAEGVHGDVGMVEKKDVILMVSNSGETEELIALVPVFKRLGVAIIVLVGAKDSSLAKASEVVIDVGVSEEACPLQLAPTASTAAAMAMGDALALTLLDRRGFTEADFAKLHPSGALGKKLLLRVSDLMRTGEALPKVSPEASFKEVILEMSSKMLGHTAVVSGEEVVGVISDGDLRRSLELDSEVFNKKARDIMTERPRWMAPDELAAEALRIMERHSISALMVCDDKKGERLAGIIHLHDLLKAGVV